MEDEKDGNLISNTSIYLDAEQIPIVEQLIEIGYDKLYSKRLLAYYHPKTIDDALNYFLKENGKIQHYFIEDQKIKENNLCFICGEKKEIHLGFISDNLFNDNYLEHNNKLYSNDILTNDIINEDNNNNIKINLVTSKFENNFIDSFSIKRENCVICNELFYPLEENTLKKCGHSFCNICWYNFLSIKIKENKLTSIKCLDYECQERLSDEFIINLIKSNKEIIEKYKKYKYELDIINDPNKKFCPFPNCNSYAELKNIKQKFVKCLNNHEFCFLCLEKPHKENPCKDTIDKSMENFAKNHFIKKCPHCGIITEKEEGCNHITCSKCNYQWCWLCNQKYDPEHFRGGKCKGLQYFKPKNEEDVKLAFEGKIQLNKSQLQEDIINDDYIVRRRHFRGIVGRRERFNRIYYNSTSKFFLFDYIIYLLFGHMFIINGILTRKILKDTDFNNTICIKYFSIFTYILIFIPYFFIQFLLNLITFIPFIRKHKNFLFLKILFRHDRIDFYIFFKNLDNIIRILNIIYHFIFTYFRYEYYFEDVLFEIPNRIFHRTVYFFIGFFHIIVYFHIIIIYNLLISLPVGCVQKPILKEFILSRDLFEPD